MIELALMLIGGAVVAFAALELWLFWYLGDWGDQPRHARPAGRSGDRGRARWTDTPDGFMNNRERRAYEVRW